MYSQSCAAQYLPQPYAKGEDVLVETKSGKLLWDAKVIGVSNEKGKEKVNGYRVHYKKWSSRFDEWVDPLRVVEPTDYNMQVQVSYMHLYVVQSAFFFTT